MEIQLLAPGTRRGCAKTLQPVAGPASRPGSPTRFCGHVSSTGLGLLRVERRWLFGVVFTRLNGAGHKYLDPALEEKGSSVFFVSTLFNEERVGCSQGHCWP